MRSSLHPMSSLTTANLAAAQGGSSVASQNRARQYAHLHAQLAQLNAHLADTQNLVRMTAVQAEYVRGLGGWMGGLFMASSKILGEETVSETPAAVEAAQAAESVRRGPAPDQSRRAAGGAEEDGPEAGDENGGHAE